MDTSAQGLHCSLGNDTLRHEKPAKAAWKWSAWLIGPLVAISEQTQTSNVSNYRLFCDNYILLQYVQRKIEVLYIIYSISSFSQFRHFSVFFITTVIIVSYIICSIACPFAVSFQAKNLPIHKPWSHLTLLLSLNPGLILRILYVSNVTVLQIYFGHRSLAQVAEKSCQIMTGHQRSVCVYVNLGGPTHCHNRHT